MKQPVQVEGETEVVAQAQSGLPTSTPPTRTRILRGNGVMTFAECINGTTERPFSDEVLVRMVISISDNFPGSGSMISRRSGPYC